MTDHRTIGGFLVVRANGEMRVVRKQPRLAVDEVAFPLTVTIPLTWGRVQPTSIDVTMPEPPEALVRIDEVQTPDDEGAQ